MIRSVCIVRVSKGWSDDATSFDNLSLQLPRRGEASLPRRIRLHEKERYQRASDRVLVSLKSIRPVKDKYLRRTFSSVVHYLPLGQGSRPSREAVPHWARPAGWVEQGAGGRGVGRPGCERNSAGRINEFAPALTEDELLMNFLSVHLFSPGSLVVVVVAVVVVVFFSRRRRAVPSRAATVACCCSRCMLLNGWFHSSTEISLEERTGVACLRTHPLRRQRSRRRAASNERSFVTSSTRIHERRQLDRTGKASGLRQ